jgi:hypothetical protein
VAKGIPQGFVSFVSGQNISQMPPEWDESKENITIFTSAEFEYNMFGEEWAHHIYKNQIEGVNRIAEAFRGDKTKHFYVRIHPSLKKKTWETDGITAIQQDNFTTIPPESSLSSYSLLMASRKILVFVSTIGIESVFWGKPVIVASRSQYQNLGATYNAQSHEEVVEFLKSDLKVKDKKGALQYGYYYATLGQPFRHYSPTSLFAGVFKGQSFSDGKEAERLRRLKSRFPKLAQWIFRFFRWRKKRSLEKSLAS